MPMAVAAREPEARLSPARRSWAWRLAAVLIVLAIAAGHLLYLQAGLVDLAEDEAYYWDWSRQLDISYYSKGPMTALLIRGGCELLGDTMPGVRLPAIILRAGLALCIYWLARRLFHSERLALGAMLLSYAVPMMLAAGMVMTTDPPFLFFWAVAMCFGVLATIENRRWAFIAAGLTVGVGFLAKFSMPLWFLGLGLFLLLDPLSRPLLRTARPYVAVLAALPFAFPVLLWNLRHNGVTFRHVSEDVGLAGEHGFAWANLIDFWTGQMGVAGPLLFLLMMAAAVHALRRPVRQAGHRMADHPERRAMLYLVCMSVPVFAGVLLTSLRTHPSANWCASTYIGLIVLTAWFLADKMARPASWRGWRLLFYPGILLNLVLIGAAHHTELLYPAVVKLNEGHPRLQLSQRRVDPTHRLHGWKEAVEKVAGYLQQMPDGSLVMAADYQTTAALAFYLPGQPRTYCAGSYFARPEVREPMSQYDIWPDRRLDRDRIEALGIAGRDALYIGPLTGDIRKAFSRVEMLEDVVVVRGGLEVRRLPVHRCSDFHGFIWPGWEGKYNK
jgi:4-amino-4-deoxy-L-arabinose transferase-like glycosyltransferase